MILAISFLLAFSPAALQEAEQGVGTARAAARELADLVDLPAPAERAARARELARRKQTSLEDWLEAMDGFGRFAGSPRGVDLHRADLRVGDQTESTELVVFVPETYEPRRPAPLLLLLHGAGGDGRGMIEQWRAFAAEAGFLLLAPTDAVGSGGYTFEPRERLAALAALRWFRRRWNVDEDRVHLSGISRGAHLGWDLATRYPDRWASFSPMIGGPSITLAEGRNNLRLVENLAPVAIRCLQGAEDDPRLLRNLRLAFERLHAAGAADAVKHEFPGIGHSFKLEAVPWEDFLTGAARTPFPPRLLHRAVRLEEGRSRWADITRFEREVTEEFEPRVDAGRWNAAQDETARLLLIQEQVDERTAQLQVEMDSPGVFRAGTKGVRKFRLLLTREMIGEDGRVSIELDGKLRKLKPRLSAEVLLQEFAERFDRRFLPVAEVEVG